jgi:hypothetical protein
LLFSLPDRIQTRPRIEQYHKSPRTRASLSHGCSFLPPPASFDTRLIVSSDAFCSSFASCCCSLLRRQRNSRLQLARLTLSTYNLDSASVAAMRRPSKPDKPTAGWCPQSRFSPQPARPDIRGEARAEVGGRRCEGRGRGRVIHLFAGKFCSHLFPPCTCLLSPVTPTQSTD